MDGRLQTALVAEFIGTFTLIFIGAGSVALSGSLVGVALAHGLVLVGFAYAYGHFSGAFVNPAVTLAVWVAGKIDAVRAGAYIVVELIGGILGALALRWVLGGTASGLGVTQLAQGLDVHGTQLTVTPAVGLAVEGFLTFLLANAVINAAVSGKVAVAGGLAVGLTLTFCILMGGPLTGASLNPARTLGPAVATGIYADLWVYFVGQAVGAIVAGVLHKSFLDR
jgi:MIP family channel proteins